MDPHIESQLIFDRSARISVLNILSFSVNNVGKPEYSSGKNINFDYYLTTYEKLIWNGSFTTFKSESYKAYERKRKKIFDLVVDKDFLD